ncbi:MAG: glycosyltransferase family 39 protein [Actinobacteria bacterium]|nr:glycosyltransferase family 39 protein [Actinomycetota bacterium]
MKKNWIWLILGLIVILAVFLRVWQLGNTPPSPDWDEVALGYDAYSIIHTGRDEFGKFLPVVLRSFDDYKPALYAYLTIPSVLLFGLNVFAVRFPSAVFGTISVIAVFFLIRELFQNYKNRDALSLIGSFFLAISPWSLQFSRVGFEANVGDTLNILTALFFIKGLKKPYLLFLSAFFAGLSIYVYQSEKVFTPLLVIALALIYWKNLLSVSKKYILAVIIFGLIVVTPMLAFIVTNRAALLRVTGTSIFSYQTELLKNDIQKLERDQARNDKLGLVLDNRRTVYAITIISGYISHFDPNWLFITGDIDRHHAPNMGILYLFEVPLILLGIYFLLFGNFDKKTKLTIFGWLLLAPVPASITTGVPHAVRTLNFLPTWQILSALGLVSGYLLIKDYKLRDSLRFLKPAIYVIFIAVASLNFVYYLDQYFVQLNYYDSQFWQYGYKQAADEVKLVGGSYKEVVISDKQPMDKSYMFFLFYLQYSPSDYQKIGETSSGGFASHHSFGKYIFRPINWSTDSKNKGVLYIGNPDEIPEGASMKTFNNLDGTPAMRIAGT